MTDEERGPNHEVCDKTDSVRHLVFSLVGTKPSRKSKLHKNSHKLPPGSFSACTSSRASVRRRQMSSSVSSRVITSVLGISLVCAGLCSVAGCVGFSQLLPVTKGAAPGAWRRSF